jgi:hypothetical protein
MASLRRLLDGTFACKSTDVAFMPHSIITSPDDQESVLDR